MSVAPAPQPPEPSPRAARPASPAPAADPLERARELDVPDPGALAGRIVAAETAIRSQGTAAAELGRWGRIQQAAYRQLVARPDWRAAVFERVPAALRPVAEANLTAGAELRALTRPVASLPSWRIVAPPPAGDLLRFYREAQGEFGVPWQYLAAIHLVETRMGRIRGSSPAGAEGPMQFLPQTWARYGQGDVNDPRDSILAAARYLAARGAPGDVARALYAYNPSNRYVRAITLYAEQMAADERAFLGYYHWQVYFRTPSGDALLEEGYSGAG